MLRTLLLFGLTCAFSLVAHGQQRIPANQNIYGVGNRGIIYDNELNFSLAIATPRDLFLGVRAGKLVSYDKMKYWSASIGSIRHSRERRENPERINFLTNRVSRSYTFAKENQLYALRVGFGTRKYLSEKARVKGVAVGYSYEFGPSLGILKPYYLEMYADEPGNLGIIVDVRHDGTNTADFLNQDRIFGASAWTVGLADVSLRPGVHAKFATHFGFGAYDEVAKSLEAGILADFFLGETDLMIESDLTPGVSNTPFYLSLYIKAQLGKRW